LATLAILQPDARATARLSGALGEVHHIVEVRGWDTLRQMAERGEIDGCLTDADHPDRGTAERNIAGLRDRHPDLAIIPYVESSRRDRFFDLGGLGVDGLVTSDLQKNALRSAVDQAFSTARGGQIVRTLEAWFGQPGPESLGWAVTHAAADTSVERMATALGQTPRGLRDALADVGLPSPATVLLWGRLLLAAERLARDRRSVEDVAFSLGYATASSLARAMKHHTGYTPRQVSEHGGMSLVLASLLPTGRRPGPSGIAARLAGILVLTLAAGCASLGLGGGGVDRRGIEAVLESPGIEQMHVGIVAVDAESGRTLYAHNPARKFVPASNQKILVTAAAMSMLGADYRFRTEVWAIGGRYGNVLDGNLVVVASGDPTLSHRYWDSGTEALRAIGDSIRAAGLGRVTGSLFVDVSSWDSATVGPTWEVEDLRYAYGATGGAFAIDEGEVEVIVEGGKAVGAPARLFWSPVGTQNFVRSNVTTSPPDSSTRLTPHYLPESRQLILDGVAEYGTVDTLSFALRDPVRQASAVLARVIQEDGLVVDSSWAVKWTEGEDLGLGCKSGAVESCKHADRVAVIESPPLSEIAAGILEPSQNWMTEQLLRSLAALYGQEGSWSEGVDLVEAFLFEHVGVDSLDVSARDGSGLSAYNLVTPRALVRVLRHMRAGPYAAEYRSALAEPGEEGSSLERRLPDLAGRVFAKTGTISNVNSLSGYLVRNDGRDVVFSILTNGSGLPSSYVRDAIDDIVRALAR